MKFVAVTIDVEPDCSPTWHYADPLSFDGVHTGIGRRLQPLFDALGVRPTYLVNNVVLEDQASVCMLRDLADRAELGTHLHPEFIEPAKSKTPHGGPKAEANQCFLPPAVEYGKLEAITELFQSSTGFRPRVFRAGRFSAGRNTIDSLSKLGYRVDTSVTPGIRWADPSREHPVDHRGAPHQPYPVGGASPSIPSQGAALLEIPVTIVARWSRLRRRPAWLRPVYSDLMQMQWIREQVERSSTPGHPVVLNMMFHNVEVLPGLSPYTRTEADCASLLDVVRTFLGRLVRDGYLPATLSEIARLFPPDTAQR